MNAVRMNKEQGIVALHYAGYTQSDGFEDCNEMAAWLGEKGIKSAGCCFYTRQDLEHILHGGSAMLCLSFGNYFENPSAEEVRKAVAGALEAAGLCVRWDGSAGIKIAVKELGWDKYYTDGEWVLD